MRASFMFAALIFRTPTVRDATRTVIFSRIVAMLTLGVLGSLAACGAPAVPEPSRCEDYPIPTQPAPWTTSFSSE